jgi:hypothetical protein
MYNNENNHHTHQPIDTEQFEIRRTVNARKDLVVVVSVASSQFTFQFHQDLQVVVVQTIGSDGSNVVYPVFRPPLNIKNVETSSVSLDPTRHCMYPSKDTTTGINAATDPNMSFHSLIGIGSDWK